LVWAKTRLDNSLCDHGCDEGDNQRGHYQEEIVGNNRERLSTGKPDGLIYDLGQHAVNWCKQQIYSKYGTNTGKGGYHAGQRMALQTQVCGCAQRIALYRRYRIPPGTLDLIRFNAVQKTPGRSAVVG